MASSAYCIAIDPATVDLKIATEIGMMVLLNKPILAVVPEGRDPTPGLTRIAHHVLQLKHPLDSLAGQAQLRAALDEMTRIMDTPKEG
jgi:hypothetical protein